MAELLINTSKGLYCPQGDFYVDPWQPVEKALITHAHSDHARAESSQYLCAQRCIPILHQRVGHEAHIEALAFGEQKTINDVKVSFHPAGHILGSAQIRIEHKGEVWVASGDYKIEPDPTCDGFEPVHCNTFITEATFALPVYTWPKPEVVNEEMNSWWIQNQERGRTSVIYGYALGKAQRILSGLDANIGPIFVTQAVHNLTEIYRQSGIDLPPTELADIEVIQKHKGKAIVIAPPSLNETHWIKKFGDVSTAFASGWMRIRGRRRRENLDRGFILSDHADWPGLHEAIKNSRAETVIVTHGFTEVFSKYLRELGIDAKTFKTHYEGDDV